MPIERRSVSLSAGDLLQAMDAYRQSAPELLPPGLVDSVTPEGGDGDSVTLSVVVRTGAGAVEARLHAASVLELLIRYCISQRIPLLRRAHKRVAVMGGLVTLMLEHETAPEPAQPGLPRCRNTPCRVECQTSPDGCPH